MIPTKKKISVLHPFITKEGGAVKMMIYLSNFLQEKNNDVIFYAFSYDKTPFLKYKICFVIKTFLSEGLGKVCSFFTIAYAIRKSDYIIIGNSPMHFVGVLSKVLFFSRAKLIWWNHHYPWYYGNTTKLRVPLKRWLERYAIQKIDLLVSNSQYLQTEIKNIFDRGSKILYPVLDEVFLKTDTKKDNQSTNVLCCYGRWVPGKNLDLISKTYENLKKIHSDLELIVGGYGEELENFTQKWKHDKNVKILGRLDNRQIIETLQKSDVFLFPSLIDSFGLVLLEAFSLGVPVVCFDRPGQDEVVQNEKNGFLVKSDKEFINAVSTILNDNSLKESFSIEAQKTALKFGRKTFESQLSDLF